MNRSTEVVGQPLGACFRSLAAFGFAMLMGLLLVASSSALAQEKDKDKADDKDKAAAADDKGKAAAADDKGKAAAADDKGKAAAADDKGKAADGDKVAAPKAGTPTDGNGPNLIRAPDGTEGQAVVVLNSVDIRSQWLIIVALFLFGLMSLLVYSIFQLSGIRAAVEKMSQGGGAPPT